ncbi:MAG: hypothetical protein LBG19_08355 [Prevotellaceae bacterium]|jgi:hypothetical protein|nr:hypothetical protein [Prevotellaceae bacterium]
MKRILLLVFAVLSVTTINAQDHFGAICFSQNFYEGTARFTSMGGAFAALGGDFTSLSINPAGIGVYRGMEFTFTPAISYSKTSSSFYNVSDVSDSRTRFGFSNMGLVAPIYTSGSSKGPVSLTVGIGYNKMNNYNSNASAIANNVIWEESMVENFVYQANSLGYKVGDLEANNAYGLFGPADWAALMAWKNTLLYQNEVDPNNKYYDLDVTLHNHNKYARTVSEGSIGEYVFSLGGNISHKLYFGLTVGIQDVNYKSYKYYGEVMHHQDAQNDLATFLYDQYYRTSGYGYNIKAGIIFRPVPELRLAFAAHTPTFFELTDEYSASQSANIIGYGWYDANSPTNFYDYRINTPYKLIAGAAYTFKSYGLISVDYEFVDYSSMRMKEHYDYVGTNGFDPNNQIIKNTLSAASNVRVGLEGNLPAGFSLRAGYSFYGSPYKKDLKDPAGYVPNENGDITVPYYSMGIGDYSTDTYSAGIGYRFKYGFVDFAYSLAKNEVEYIIDSYDDFGIMSPVTTKTDFNRFTLTLGLRF